ncbi:MAG: hypothetical protein D6693_07725 [Planctomycetota bacterium]|nr:MAG: hypothetical protein D6693_07725 [Planctomycetota bacterium]
MTHRNDDTTALARRLADEAERLLEPGDPDRVSRAVEAARSSPMLFERGHAARWRTAALPVLAAASLALAVSFLAFMHARSPTPAPAGPDPADLVADAFDGLHAPERLVEPLSDAQRLARLATPEGLARGARALLAEGARVAERLPIARPVRLLRDAAGALRQGSDDAPSPAPTGA